MKVQNLKQFQHKCASRLVAAWSVWITVRPMIVELWLYFRGRGGMIVAEPVTRTLEAEQA